MNILQHVFLIEQQKYAFVKSKIDENVFSCEVDGQEDMLELSEENFDSIWTKKVNIRVRVILSGDEIQTVAC